MFYGVAYYPEHWDESQWENDAQNIVDAGMDVVRIAEFAWTKMEPRAGQFDFDWLDKAIDILGNAGLNVILCTPTATPPSWLIQQYPDILPQNADGIVMKNGVRKFYCHSNQTYREYSARITLAMAERYGNNPHVVGWQIDNELGDHDTIRCYCPRCRQGFIKWCENKFGTIDNLNDAWGTVFWNQTYSTWDEIDLPYPRREIGLNPGHLLDYYRFASDMVIEFAEAQVDILRDHIAKSQWITTNIIPTYWEIDFHKLGKILDFVSWDCYAIIDATSPVRQPDVGPSPPVEFPPRSSMISLVQDIMRSVSEKPFMVMETAGQDRLVSYHTLAHGGQGVNFFRWKGVRFGAEQRRGGYEYHSIFSPRFHESQQLSKELHQLDKSMIDAPYQGQVGIFYSIEMGWAYDIHYVYPRSRWIDAVGYWRLLEEYYSAFWQQNISVEPVTIAHDWSQLPVMIIPCLYLTTPELNEKLAGYVANGGTLIVGPASGTKDNRNAFIDELPPSGKLKEVFGCELIGTGSFGYFDVQAQVTMKADAPFAEGETFSCKMESTDKIGFFSATRPAEILRPTTATVLAHYEDGQVACTSNLFGKGQAIYIGFSPDDDFMTALIRWLQGEKKLQPLMNTPDGVEVTARGDALFIINHQFVPVTIHFNNPCFDLVNHRQLQGDVQLDAQSALVIREQVNESD